MGHVGAMYGPSGNLGCFTVAFTAQCCYPSRSGSISILIKHCEILPSVLIPRHRSRHRSQTMRMFQLYSGTRLPDNHGRSKGMWSTKHVFSGLVAPPFPFA